MTAEETLTISDEIEEQTALPEGWRLVRLGDVCSFIYGSSLSTTNREKGDVPVYGSNGLVGYHNQAITKGQTIIIGRKGSVGEVNFSTCACFPIDTTYFIDETATELDLRFLFHLLKSVNFKELNKSTAVPGLNREDAYAVKIPLPPTIEEQRRIAAVLDEQMKAVEQARRAVEEQLAAAKLLPNAFLRSVFESEDAQNWQKRKLGDFAKVQSGYAFKTDWYVKDGIRLLRNANVFQGYIDWSDVVNLSLESRPKFESYELNEGDIVLSLDRPLVSNGLKVSKLTSKDVPSLLLQRVGRFLLKDGLETEFLYTFLNSDIFINSIKGHDQSLGVPHISPTQVENMEIHIPSIEEQKTITRKINEQMQEAEKLKKTLTEQLEAIKKMPSALLRKAFAG